MQKNDRSLRSLKVSMVIGYALIIIIIVLAMSFVTIRMTENVLKENVSALSTDLNSQMRINIMNYLERCESTATLVFADPDNYTYDATDPANDEYEALNTESRISQNLFNLCIMENFVDFGIVYSNNHVVGKISHGTKDDMGSGLYDTLSAMITRKGTQDGWYSGVQGDYRRIYYVKRLNENAVLAVSVYSDELDNILEHPDAVNDMVVRLVDRDLKVIYTSADENITRLPDALRSDIQGQTSATLNGEKYITSINQCNDDWFVVTSIPTEYISVRQREIQRNTMLIAVAAAIIAIIIDILISFVYTEPIGKLVDMLGKKADYDQLTGLLNKRTYEERARALIASSDDKIMGFILVDLDNFKSVNDTMGHKVGDTVLAATGDIIRRTFPDDEIKGRVGGDEFSIITDLGSRAGARDRLEEKCAMLTAEFRHCNASADKNYKISASIGAAMFPDAGMTFDDLYSNADKALYSSKDEGRDTYNVYEA